jgi:hypothetical protein
MNYQKIHLLQTFSGKMNIFKSINTMPDFTFIPNELGINPKFQKQFIEKIQHAFKKKWISENPSVIMFSSKSKDTLPTKGTKERKGTNDSGNWEKISKKDDFRKELSNFSPMSTKWNLPNDLTEKQIAILPKISIEQGYLSFHTVEHGFHFGKFWFTGYYKEAIRLTREYSGNDKIKPDGESARKARKLVKLDMSTEFPKWAKKRHVFITNLIIEKGIMNPKFKKLLKKTGNSLLIHSPGRSTAMPEFPIMEARYKFKNENNI